MGNLMRDTLLKRRHLPPIPEPRPRKPSTAGGRPPIGPEVKTRIPERFLVALDQRASEAGITRAEQVRRDLATIYDVQ